MKKFLSFILTALFSLTMFAGTVKPEMLPDKGSDKDLSAISALAISRIIRTHLDGKDFDRVKQNLMFQALLKTLDPYKMFLLQSDVDAFHDYMVKNPDRIQRGDLSLPFMIFNLVQKRYCEYAAVAREILSRDTSGLMSSNQLVFE